MSNEYRVFPPELTGLVQGERFAETKKRLQARLAVPDKDFAKYRFALIQVATFKQPSYIEDGTYHSVLIKV